MVFPKHLLDLSAWDKDQYLFFFDLIQKAKKDPFDLLLSQKKKFSVGLIFQEPSTRTKISFQRAIDALGGKSYIVHSHQSSLAKGESLLDTVQTLGALGIDHVVVRASNQDVFDIAEHTKGCLINAGSGDMHHPTQGLLDAYTLWEYFGRLESLRIVMVGDLVRSRVVQSNLRWMKAFNIQPILWGPQAWLDGFEGYETYTQKDTEGLFNNVDVVMLHRIQKERMQTSEHVDQCYNFHADYGLSQARLSQAKGSTVVMHPGPINRGVEISDEVARSAQSLIHTQVENGMWTRRVLMQNMVEACQ